MKEVDFDSRKDISMKEMNNLQIKISEFFEAEGIDLEKIGVSVVVMRKEDAEELMKIFNQKLDEMNEYLKKQQEREKIESN